VEWWLSNFNCVVIKLLSVIIWQKLQHKISSVISVTVKGL
jgi:hypothetical protein